MSDPTDPHQEEEPLGKVYDARLMRRLVGYLRPYVPHVVTAVALILLSSVLQLFGPLATAVAIDLFIRPPGEAEALGGASAWVAERLAGAGIDLAPADGLALIGVAYLAVVALTFVVLYFQAYVMQLMGQHIMFDLRTEIFGKLQRQEVAYFDKNPIGRLVTRVTNDVDSLNELFTAGLVSIIGDVVLLAGIVGVLFWLDWRLAVITFSILPLLLALTFWFKKRARESYRTVRVKLARINSFLQEHITGMSIVQLFNREARAAADFADINQDHRDANVRAIFYYAVYYPAVELVTAVGVALILWYGGVQVMSATLSVGVLVAFLQYAQRFYQPLADLSEKYNILQSAMASSERVFRLLDRDVTVRTIDSGAFAPGRDAARVAGRVELENVSFHYNPGEPVLRDVSLRIAPGETLAIVGHTGAGKSTLANLILRFYDVQEGRVAIDGVDVRDWDLQALRRTVGLVLQDVFLFSGDLADNIRLGDRDITDEDLEAAAREVHALDFIQALPKAFDTPVRERGAGLSVGQKQLIAFARALAHDPKILILDEATSSVDTETEQKIQLALDRLLADRTSIVIAHRLSTIQKADRIVVMHKGEVREEGTHRELVAAGGVYRRLFELQYEGMVA